MSGARSRLGWVWYGGRPSVDFVNTRRYRFAGGRELLERPSDLAAWLRAAELVPGRPDVDGALLEDAVRLREAIDAGIGAVVGGERFPAEAAGTVNEWLALSAGRPPRLDLSGGVPALRPAGAPGGARDALVAIALDAAEILGSDLRDRLRICAGTDCSGRFFDHSAGRRRRWCDMAACGNRAKAAQHRRARSARQMPGDAL
ncbi:CGNR zinc finger domain-containing protein [Actinomadura roseirufa]|uniref:CGNR zinc finger domain-containing protein n=1 Tax=Actinomadura roseirufa TaxID=2094049 RepID=UPI001041B263|nr:ABATE domain-containing protein [Actinomadura roseirufa]